MGTPLLETSNIKVEACNVLFGDRKVFTVGCVADEEGSLNGLKFAISAFSELYVESTYTFTISTGTAAPMLTGTAVAVSIASGSTAAAVAALVKTAIELLPVRGVSIADNVLTVTLEYFGNATAPSAGTSGFTVTEVTAGSGGYLGATQDGIEITFEKTMVPVEIDQTGSQLQDDILTGVSCAVGTTILELTAANMSVLIGSTFGAEFTPSAGTKVIGVGTSKNFSNMLQYAKELILKPLNTTDTDFTTSHFFWKAFPDLSGINLSGTELKNAPVTFKCYRDSTKEDEISLYCFGDGTQDLDA